MRLGVDREVDASVDVGRWNRGDGQYSLILLQAQGRSIFSHVQCECRNHQFLVEFSSCSTVAVRR